MSDQDYIIIGAGSAGCVLANRLTENPANRVLLLEAGGRDNSVWINMPIGYIRTMDMARVNWLFDSEPEPGTANRPIPIPRGRVIGGSSSINGMIYVRGQQLDYDGWAQAGNRGWSFEDVLPYFIKLENREGPAMPARGKGGPLNVADMRKTHELLDAVVAAGGACGVPANPDYNGASQDGFGYYQVTQKNGRRHSAARAYLDPARRRPNLRVETGAHVLKILTEGRVATGVAYRQNGTDHTALADREVILSAGGVQSPQILELSGIGNPDILAAHGIDTVHALTGVGENYQDHYVSRVVLRTNRANTLNQTTRGIRLAGEVLKYFLAGRGDLTLTAGIIYGFVRSRPELASPDIQFHCAHASFKDSRKRILDREPGLTLGPCQLRPESRGTIHIRSADPAVPPAIRPQFLTTETDRQTHVAGLKFARRLAEAPPLAKFCEFEVAPGADCRSDDELLDFARSTGATLYHPVGTCRMGEGADAVVDERLRVRGIGALRVVDASIMPALTSGNTNGPTIMIAEKGADMILADAKA